MARDYYVARNRHGARLWVFRNRREARTRQGGSCMAGSPEPCTPNCTASPTSLSCAAPRAPEELVERAAQLGYAALAITDECSVAGVVRAHVAAKDHGLKLIVGAEFRLEDGLRCVLLAQDRAGYGRLCRLITRGRRAAPKGAVPSVPQRFREIVRTRG